MFIQLSAFIQPTVIIIAYILTVTALLQLVFLFFRSVFSFFGVVRFTIFESVAKIMGLAALISSFFLYLILASLYFFFYIRNNSTLLFCYNVVKIIPLTSNLEIFGTNLLINIELFSLLLIMIGYIVGFLSLLAIDTRLFWKNVKYVSYFNIFMAIVFLFSIVHNFLVFFLLYECLMLPSVLIVYYVSPSKRALQAAIYFLLWTQLGSLIALIGVTYIVVFYGISTFPELTESILSLDEVYMLYFLFFLGFGIKVPIWPMHYWLTKTHVEAPAGFSMYLSGFLVKTAVYAFYKFSNSLGYELQTFIFITVCAFGIADASLKMWSQTDLKKLVAYGTIQEMNLIYIVFFFGDSSASFGGMIFCLTHSVLSALMFFIVDCVQRKYNSRYLVELSGILHVTPNLGIAIFFMCVFFSGIPGTLKFSSEFIIFSGMIETGGLFFALLLITANVFGLIGFLKCWFNVLFGFNTTCYNNPPLDLTIKETLIISFCFFSLILFNFLSCLIF